MSEENKVMVRRLMEAINEGDMDVVDELFVPKLARPMKRSFIAFRSAFPDWRMEIAELIAEGNTVVGRFRCSGTNQGEFKGVPPTGSGSSSPLHRHKPGEAGTYFSYSATGVDLSRATH